MIISGFDPDDVVDDEDLHVGYGRFQTPRFRPLFNDDEDLPEHITKRLAMIREKALQKYRETMI